VSGQTIVGTSPNATSIGATVTKKFTPGLTNQSIVAEYSIQSTVSGKSVAPWEDTRVFPGGLTFYPTGDLAPTGGRSRSYHPDFLRLHLVPVSGNRQRVCAPDRRWQGRLDRAHHLWRLRLGQEISRHRVDRARTGRGRNFHLRRRRGQVHRDRNPGRLRGLALGPVRDLDDHWYVRKLPTGISATPNQALVDWVRGLIQQ